MDAYEALCFFDTLMFVVLGPLIALDYAKKNNITFFQFIGFLIAIIFQIYLFYAVFFGSQVGPRINT